MWGATTWKPDAVIRLFFSVFVCWFAGSVVAGATPYLKEVTEPKAVRVLSVAAASLCALAGSLWLTRKAWTLDGFMKQMTAVLVLFYAGIILGTWSQKLAGNSATSALQISMGAISFQGAALVLTTFFLREHGLNWHGAFGLRHRRRDALLAGVTTACLFLPVGWALQHLSSFALSYFQPFGFKPEEQVAVQVLRTAGFPDRFTLAIITIVLAPLAEEVLFRGILFRGIQQFGFPRLAFWGTALVFAFVHFNIVSFVPLLVLALALAWLYERTGNLLAPIAAHSTFNALNFLFLFLVKSGTPPK